MRPRPQEIESFRAAFGASLIGFKLPRRSEVSVVVFDLLGREIARIAHEVNEAGVFTSAWNGKDDKGSQLSSGVYLLRMVARPADGSEAYIGVRKMVLLR